MNLADIILAICFLCFIAASVMLLIYLKRLFYNILLSPEEWLINKLKKQYLYKYIFKYDVNHLIKHTIKFIILTSLFISASSYIIVSINHLTLLDVSNDNTKAIIFLLNASLCLISIILLLKLLIINISYITVLVKTINEYHHQNDHPEYIKHKLYNELNLLFSETSLYKTVIDNKTTLNNIDQHLENIDYMIDSLINQNISIKIPYEHINQLRLMALSREYTRLSNSIDLAINQFFFKTPSSKTSSLLEKWFKSLFKLKSNGQFIRNDMLNYQPIILI